MLGGTPDSENLAYDPQETQNRKFAPLIMRRRSKNARFFVCKLTAFVNQVFAGFVRWLWLESLIVTRVKSFGKKRFSNRVTKNCDSRRVIHSSHPVTIIFMPALLLRWVGGDRSLRTRNTLPNAISDNTAGSTPRWDQAKSEVSYSHSHLYNTCKIGYFKLIKYMNSIRTR